MPAARVCTFAAEIAAALAAKTVEPDDGADVGGGPFAAAAAVVPGDVTLTAL